MKCYLIRILKTYSLYEILFGNPCGKVVSYRYINYAVEDGRNDKI